MGLQSELFRGDPHLEACLNHDSAHIVEKDAGFHVAKVQAALLLLGRDGGDHFWDEFDRQTYGPETASVVRAYKKDNGIINFKYETSADPIVGKMTIAFLDKEIRKWEVSQNRVTIQIEAGGASANIFVGRDQSIPITASLQIQRWKSSWDTYRDLHRLTLRALLSALPPDGLIANPAKVEVGDCRYDTASLFCFAGKNSDDVLMVLWGFPLRPAPGYPPYSGRGLLKGSKNGLAEGPISWEILLVDRPKTSFFHSHIGRRKIVFTE